MKKANGNVILNVILILGVCTVLLNGLFLVVMNKSELNSLKNKESSVRNIDEEQRKKIINSAILQGLKPGEVLNEDVIKNINKSYGNFKIYYDNSSNNLVLKKKVTSSIEEYYYYEYEKINNDIFLKERKYYEVK